uniref:Bifunctional polynucleotide phosphatase/kinase n=1 Tax=Lingulaulax polyedra TaxID=160621 RepID=A0A516AGG9_LINPO|nr:bifunctional polynucleotide phosphatase/kinase [Lingulodinium polyedra]|mmetsp:Transcript_2871/g.8891  ORF Transcript_2871/g.8891 Transcript_2871/m.8891 type:complete len:220 (+) Transcript_2871:122-781(+)
MPPLVPGARALQRSRAGLEMLAAIRLPAPWLREGWCLYRCPVSVRPSARVAAFDFDKTLHFGGAAWRLSSVHVTARLRQLYDAGYNVAIFSNQHAAGRQLTHDGMEKAVRETISRFDDFVSFCGLPLQVFIAVARGDVNDPFRKPNTGMWQLLATSPRCNGGTVPDARQSFYVGNSAGRSTDGNSVDIEFARRVGLEFRTEDWLSPRGPLGGPHPLHAS